WDHHNDVRNNIVFKAEEVDRPTAALITDLKQRGMLDDTLVIWGGEFGRTPMSQRNGRDHHIKGFSFMLAGGGIKKGLAYGATDELGDAADGGAGCRGNASLVSAGVIPRSDRTNDRRSGWTCHRATPQRGWQHRGSRAGRRGDAGMQAVARLRQPAWPHAPVAAARAVETNDGVHVHVPICVASRPWRRARGRPRLERKSLGLSARGPREAAA